MTVTSNPAQVPAPRGGRERSAPGRWRRGPLGVLLFLLLLGSGALGSCGVFPDEFNLSPIYRHRVGPSGQLEELDLLWPLFHWQRDPMTGGSDTRLRPLWRQIRIPDRDRVEHQYLAPLGDAYADPEEDKISLFPFFYYRKHLEEGHADAWDIDWNVLYLLYGGQSSDGEDYFGLLPIYGRLRDFLTFDEFGWFLFPLHLWWEKGTAHSTQFLWPLISWGSDGQEGGGHWFRFLPFYGEDVQPGVSETYSLLWPFFHWGTQEGPRGTTDEFMVWPLFGWSVGPRYHLYTFLWPLFRYGYEVATDGEPDFWQLDFPFPFARFRWDDTTHREIVQHWFFPLFGHTTTTTKDAVVAPFPIGWFETWTDDTGKHTQNLILPFFYDLESRRRKAGDQQPEDGEVAYEDTRLRRLRIWPLYGKREDHDGSWSWQFFDLWPYDGEYAYGINEAYDWIWVLAEERGDSRGNTRLRTFGNVFTSRNFAGRRYQCSVPLLFNYVQTESGESTLRLLQFLPIRWGTADRGETERDDRNRSKLAPLPTEPASSSGAR